MVPPARTRTEGPVTFNYSIQPHAVFRASDAAKFGAERRQPLIVAPSDSSSQPQAPLMQLSSPELLVSAIKPIAGGHNWLAYLYNPTETEQKAVVRWNNRLAVSIRSSDAAGYLGGPLKNIDLAGFDSGYFVISKANDSPDADRD